MSENEILNEKLSKIERMLEDFLEELNSILQKPKRLDKLKISSKPLQNPRSEEVKCSEALQ